MSTSLTRRQETLFSRLGRYRPTALRIAREDRLTEALAATLEACPSVAMRLVSEWFGRAPSGALAVATQTWVGPTDRIDLELVFGPVKRPEFRVWFEAKVDAKPTSDQILRYRETLGELAGESRLLWLLPTGVRPGAPLDGVEEKTWQQLASLVDSWLRELDKDEQDSYPAGLAREFVRHLEEEGDLQ
jgi:hypothetical protein